MALPADRQGLREKNSEEELFNSFSLYLLAKKPCHRVPLRAAGAS
jgi:hypothetical protein